MKLVHTIALVAMSTSLIYSNADAAVSAGCNTYLTNLEQPSDPLSKCRVYTALGFPGLTHSNDRDTVKLQKALTNFCATPACTKEQYAGVYKDIQTNCAADMVPENQATLGTTMYMWYLSPAQREAVCLLDPSKNSSCVIDSINDMIARGQFPNDNKNEDDLYGYLQYVTPMLSAKGTNSTSFCTACNQEVANIFSNYYTKNPSPYSLNFAQQLNSSALNTDILYQYKANCKVTLGTDQSAFKPTNVTDPKNTKDSKDGKENSALALDVSFGKLVGAAAMFAGALAML
ncbi:hypothetical protein BGX26_013058 [Mortierella sp. AD094]|nr:hypothetical protein BGX26_013058 [Mortierella sp. AD094]